jgi:hypothetical protein
VLWRRLPEAPARQQCRVHRSAIRHRHTHVKTTLLKCFGSASGSGSSIFPLMRIHADPDPSPDSAFAFTI